MNLKKLGLITALASASFLSACAGCSNNNKDSSGSGSGGIPDGYVRVYFYRDFSQPDSGEYLSYQDVPLGSKVTRPETPTPLFLDFPNFVGWSKKEVIKDTSDLWNFDTDTVVPLEEGANTFEIYAIWSD